MIIQIVGLSSRGVSDEQVLAQLSQFLRSNNSSIKKNDLVAPYNCYLEREITAHNAIYPPVSLSLLLLPFYVL